MSLTPISSWTLQSPDSTVWRATISTDGIVSWISGGSSLGIIPVFQGVPGSVIWTPSISNAGVLSITDGVAAGQFWATVIDPVFRRWYFLVNADGVISLKPLSQFALDEVAIYAAPLSLGRIQAHYAARLTTNNYASTVLADAPVGYWRLGESAISQLDGWPPRPFSFEINNIDRRDWLRVSSLRIEDTAGQPVTAEFTLVNAILPPQTGDQIEMRYYDLVVFAGTVDRVEITASVETSVRDYHCTCVDWSHRLMRHKVRRNFTDEPLANIVDSLLESELQGEELTVGLMDRGPTMPLVDSKSARAFDILRDTAAATGQSFVVGFDKTLNFLATSNPPTGPTAVTASNVEESSLVEDRETYRNVQDVVVTGTPAQGEDAQVAIVERRNEPQIAFRATLEGGTGIYEEIEEVTHPTSNDAGDLTLLGIGVANLRLATAGLPRRVLTCRVRGYGWRAGQFVTVTLPHLNATGIWFIQKVSFQEQDKEFLLFNLELTQSNTQLRSYEAWLNVVKAGKVVIRAPGVIASNLASFDTPGTFTWTVPAGVTILEVTCYGGSGGGGGGSLTSFGITGGYGGNSGKAITIPFVLPGQVLTIVVGAAGSPGITRSQTFAASGEPGTAGTLSSITLNGKIICQGNGGLGGGGAFLIDHPLIFLVGADGTPGSGIGDAVSIGGGKVGGIRGSGNPFDHPGFGADGLVEVRW